MLKELRLDELAASPTNPRKTFDASKLEELSRSIAQKGVLEPILVRPHPNGGGATYEIVAGERRFRAATIAAVETVPCIVRELSDVEALEVQAIENLQRDDLHPLEEADGYAALMKEAGWDVQQIAQRIGKSDRYVYDRLKLLQLTPKLKAAFLDGEITVGHAILLARLSAADQERAADGSSNWDVRGLWQVDLGRDERGLELDDERKRKPVSVRELQKWIDDQVRLRPEEVDLPTLFPDTAAALERAEEEELKVVHITREYRVSDGARDKQRTYGEQSWKRADGEADVVRWSERKRPSDPCEHRVMGIVVSGPGRGDAFYVCVAKKKCQVHWSEEQKEAARAKKAKGSQPDRAQQDRDWEERQRREAAERERWEKAGPALLDAVVEKLNASSAEGLVDMVVDAAIGHRAPGEKEERIGRGKTVEQALRYAVYRILRSIVTNPWQAVHRGAEALKPLGLDAKSILDEASPKEKPKPADPIRAAVEEALEENPDASTEELQELGKGVDADVAKLTRRQFNARYVLPVKRKTAAAKKSRAKKGVAIRMPGYSDYLRTDAWRKKREQALERAGHRCQLCGCPHHLDVHHNTYERVGAELPVDLVVLCRLCHRVHHERAPKHPAALAEHDPKGLARALSAQARARTRVRKERGIAP
jgi:ParB/RepB/Spo0J family partition protein